LDEQHLIERYESKYLLSPEQVPIISAAISSYCQRDKASLHGPYAISSLYLDSPRFLLYHNTKAGITKRFKLRVRRYENNQLFLEIKDKYKDVIIKTRSVIPYEKWPDLLIDPGLIDQIQLEDPQSTIDFHRFLNLMLLTQAQPVVVVKYLRDAWYSPLDEYARITFDYAIECAPPHHWDIPILPHETQWIPSDFPKRFHLPHSGVVLEIKTRALIPPWINDLIRTFGLKRSGYSKYCSSLETLYPMLGSRIDPRG
jgi:SPX domain protein involved in polyphosphate accumulation